MTEQLIAEVILEDAANVSGVDTIALPAAVTSTATAAETVDASALPLIAVDTAPITAAPQDNIVAAEPASDAVVPAAGGRKHAKRTVALHTGYVGTGYYGELVVFQTLLPAVSHALEISQ